ncbi:MAG: nicotinamide riboside transporter PnuC [Bacteroidota bacterium]|nr:nicotinamide riboside transporter PnuC [Bacteroidota bacterium]
MNAVVDWVSTNYIELIAASLGLIAISLQIKQNIWYWLVSIVMVSLYIYVYIQAKLYADMSLQIYFLVISFYGWYYWLYGNKKNKKKEATVSKINKKSYIIISLIAIVFFWGIAWILKSYTDSDIPYWDSFTTTLSFIATWMLARKYIENWLVWIVADFVSIGIYIYKGLYPTTVLFIVLTILAFVGYSHWLKDLKNQKN